MRKEADGDLLYREKICTMCGKKFFQQSSDWAYRRYDGKFEKMFCSWRCVREWEKGHKETLRERKERMQLERELRAK